MSKPGTLFLVSTPIGNLEDITLRALRLLGQVSLVACEDTRHTAILFRRHGIATPRTSFHEHNERQKSGELIERLLAGEDVALVSDAGTPAVSNPGYRLVAAAVARGLRVEPVPGPSAAMAALTASGMPPARFAFLGFLPSRTGERRRALAEAARLSLTLVLYEAPHRLLATLADMAEILGPHRPLAVARELTKLHEEVLRGTAGELLRHFQASPPRGEITLVVAPPGGLAGRARTGTPLDMARQGRAGEPAGAGGQPEARVPAAGGGAAEEAGGAGGAVAGSFARSPAGAGKAADPSTEAGAARPGTAESPAAAGRPDAETGAGGEAAAGDSEEPAFPPLLLGAPEGGGEAPLTDEDLGLFVNWLVESRGMGRKDAAAAAARLLGASRNRTYRASLG